MTRFLAALLFSLLTCPAASAQGCGPSNPNCVVPDRPNGDSTNSAADTRFVQNAFAGGSSLALPNGDFFIGSASNLAVAQPITGDFTCTNLGVCTFATVNSNVGSFGSATQCAAFTVNGKGLTTAASQTTCTPAFSSITGTPTTLGGYGITNARPTLTASTTYWVNGNSGGTATCGTTGASTCSAGNDSNDCLTPATSCLTLQHVVNLVIASRDAAGFSVAVNLAHNAGTTNYTAQCLSVVLGTATISVFGDGNAPTAVVAQAQTLGGIGAVLVVKDNCTMGMINLEVIDNVNSNASNFFAVGTGNAGHVDLTNITFGSLGTGTAVAATYHGSIGVFGSDSVIGSEVSFVSIGGGGSVDFSGATVNGSSSLTFTNFASLQGGFIVGASAGTFTGFASISGPKCIITSGQVSIPAGSPDQIFPGSTACTDQFRATNSLSGDVAMNNTSNYFDGPSMAQGTAGVWLATGGVTVNGNANDIIRCKLWDGTNTAVDSTQQQIGGGAPEAKIALSGFVSSPAGNIRISCRNITSTTSTNIVFNGSANSHDSTVSGYRVR
jgi:hypothetical protein